MIKLEKKLIKAKKTFLKLKKYIFLNFGLGREWDGNIKKILRLYTRDRLVKKNFTLERKHFYARTFTL